MSLDERTLEWLKKRRSPQRLALCCRTSKAMKFYAMTQKQCCYCDLHRSRSREYCPLVSDFKDAAEFEARVAAKMASTLRPCENCPDFLQAPRCPALGLRPYYCMLRNARLAVEAEMEMEGK